MPKFSIVSIVLNDPEGLALTARSILAQSCRDFEWIVIDGGSSAPTQSILLNYRNAIDILVSEKDNGVYDAMAKGVRLARGDWLNFMNAGDRFAHDHVLASLNNAGDVAMSYGMTEWDKGPTFRPIIRPRPLSELPLRIAFWHQSFFCKTELARELGFDDRLKIAADYDFYARAVARGETFRNQHIVVSRFKWGGLSHKRTYRRHIERLFASYRSFRRPGVIGAYLSVIGKQMLYDVSGGTLGKRT